MDRGLTHSASFKMIFSHSTLVCNVMLSIKRLHSGGTTSQYTSVLQVRPASTEEYTEDAVYHRIPTSVCRHWKAIYSRVTSDPSRWSDMKFYSA